MAGADVSEASRNAVRDRAKSLGMNIFPGAQTAQE